jgi:hypothetical protein
MKARKNILTPAEFQRLKESFQERLVEDPDMTHGCLRVGLAISWHMNKDTGEAWPGTNAITRRARVSRSAVRRAVKYLIARGHVAVERTRGKVMRYYPQPMSAAELLATGAIALTPVCAGTTGVIALTATGARALTPEPLKNL